MSISTHQMMAWLSPSFPTGAFAYSHGLEYAIATSRITDALSLEEWLRTLLQNGSAWNDAVLLSHAYRGEEISELAISLASSKERLQESLDQGSAFARTVTSLLDQEIERDPLPSVLGKTAQAAGVPLNEFLPLTLHAFSANLVSAAVRLVPLGQTEGQIVLRNLFPIFERVAAKAEVADLDDLGSSTFIAEITAMRHETMTTRIFRT